MNLRACLRKIQQQLTADVTVIPREQHQVSRKLLSPNALKVLRRLEDHGYQAYLVGGCIRDILVGGRPKDFDVATTRASLGIRQDLEHGRIVVMNVSNFLWTLRLMVVCQGIREGVGSTIGLFAD